MIFCAVINVIRAIITALTVTVIAVVTVTVTITNGTVFTIGTIIVIIVISTINLSYYTEKKHYLPNYWADKDNFEYLLSLIDRNLLFEDDIKRICKRINSIDECPEDGCISGKCKRHPFSMLYNMGYLGYILKNSNNSNQEVMNFKDSSQISYFYEKDTLITADRAAYIIHPALTKAIEKNYNKSLMHFSGFILGKGRTVDKEILSKIIEDKKNLDAEVFKSKYYFKP